MTRVALLVALAGCGSPAGDPCDGQSGACVSLVVVSGAPTVTEIDQLEIRAEGAATLDGRTPPMPGGVVALPARTALLLDDAAGTVDVTVFGWLRGGMRFPRAWRRFYSSMKRREASAPTR